ncbi:hypothetical protein EDM68_02230 [Candidatus Uhrbacteria bacterium]|nr:MAG: hypothetical protein EDM68_02230 [Candidatus Uhrbacteria bacterium]
MNSTLQLNRRAVIIGAAFLSVVALSGAGLVTSVYVFQREDALTRSLSGWFRVPAARLGSRVVTYDEYLAHLGSLRLFLEGPLAAAQGLGGTIGPEQRRSALDRAIRIAAIDEMAAAAELTATPLDVERAYDGLVAQAGTSTTPGELQDFLRDQFGWNESDFKRYVIRPALLEDALRAKRTRETGDATAFDRELEERLKREDVVYYLRFQ